MLPAHRYRAHGRAQSAVQRSPLIRVGGKPLPFIAMFAKQNARRAPPFSLLRICASRLHLPDTWIPRARLATADFLLCCVRFGTGVHIATPASAPEANVRASAPVVHHAVFHRSTVTPTVPSNSAPIPTFPVQSRNNPTCFLLRIARATRCAHAHAAHRPNIRSHFACLSGHNCSATLAAKRQSFTPHFLNARFK